jgi:SAM-dependent methyltransferase
MKKPYEKEFYTSETPEVLLQSPREIVPLVMSLVSPRRVVDIGCGAGAWLYAFREQGVEQVLGIEGDYVDPSWLLIPKECVRLMDLRKPFRLQEAFDLAVCLEVAEHLPKRCAEQLVDSLVSLAPIVLFSAAVPLQGGVHHVNEQWPDYWASIFIRRKYQQLDLLREHIWKNPAVKSFYRQNIFLYVREDLIARKQEFLEATKKANNLMLVEPYILAAQLSLGSILRNFPRAVWGFLGRRLTVMKRSVGA